MKENKPGNILWHDLTVDNAENVSDFYHEVVGGICHAKGVNKNLPART